MGGLGGMLGGLGSLFIPGNPMFAAGLFGKSPWSQGLGVFAAKTMYNMQNQDTLELTTTATDLKVQGFAMYPQKLTGSESIDNDIKVEQNGNARADNRIDSKLQDQSFGLTFTNNNPESKGTFYKLFKVKGERHAYALEA